MVDGMGLHWKTPFGKIATWRTGDGISITISTSIIHSGRPLPPYVDANTIALSFARKTKALGCVLRQFNAIFVPHRVDLLFDETRKKDGGVGIVKGVAKRRK